MKEGETYEVAVKAGNHKGTSVLTRTATYNHTMSSVTRASTPAALIRTCPSERLRPCRKEDSALKCWPPGITIGHSDTEGRDEGDGSGRVIYTMPRRSSD
ncbi:hypothetical protein E2C01_089703 [Portunus trituberculatus]|uniref:Uncharacterized protein n=1 Tax=Portunus trituberculatus TaxID=210409 RepID=A0A5B7JCR5_PORTR|nr:hypothetical protein [Portunus trituberculatus]